MITDDQIAELFARANPAPTPDALNPAQAVEDGTTPPTLERGGMSAVPTRERKATKRMRRPVAAALPVILVAVISLPLLLGDNQRAEIPAPPIPEEVAVFTVQRFMAALTEGDADGALALIQTELHDSPGNREAVEFFAALPGPKTVTDCVSREGSGEVTVTCETNYNGPLMQAIGEDSEGRFSVRDGLLSTMFVPGSRDATAEAFVEYARGTDPEAFEQACSPASYEAGSVRTHSSGMVFAGPCGELWAGVADDAVAWVEAGRPPLPEEG